MKATHVVGQKIEFAIRQAKMNSISYQVGVECMKYLVIIFILLCVVLFVLFFVVAAMTKIKSIRNPRPSYVNGDKRFSEIQPFVKTRKMYEGIVR